MPLGTGAVNYAFGQAIGLLSKTVTIVETPQPISVDDKGLIYVVCYDPVAANNTITLGEGGVEGQILTLVNYESLGGSFTLDDSANVNLEQVFQPTYLQTITLQWTADTLWNEIGRSELMGGGGFNPNIVSPQDGQVIVYNGTSFSWENQSLSGVITMDGDGVTSIEPDSIVDADINTAAAISLSKLEQPAVPGLVLIGDAGSNWSTSAITGDINVDSTGNATFTAGAIVDADINALAAIQFSKLAALNSGRIIVGNVSNQATSTAVSGVIAMSNAGVTSFPGVAFNPQPGDVFTYNGTEWTNVPGSQTFVVNGSISSGQINNLAGSPITLVSGAAGSAIIPLGMTCFLIGGGPFTGGSPLKISCGPLQYMSIGTDFLTANSSPSTFYFTPQATQVPSSGAAAGQIGVDLWDSVSISCTLSVEGADYTGAGQAISYYFYYTRQQIFDPPA
jgi:hypothetical protein